jgi:AcrR family transcriptional regulator
MVSAGDERARVRAALTDLVAERGFAATTTGAVIDRAGVDRAAFDRSYSDLTDCFCVVLQEQTDELLARVLAVFDTDDAWRDQVRAVGLVMSRFLLEDRARARMMTVESPVAGPRSQLIRDQGMQSLIELVDLGRRELADPESVSRYTAETIGSAVYDRMRVAIERGEWGTLESMLPDMMYTVVLPYLGPEAAMEELRRPSPEMGEE